MLDDHIPWTDDSVGNGDDPPSADDMGIPWSPRPIPDPTELLAAPEAIPALHERSEVEVAEPDDPAIAEELAPSSDAPAIGKGVAVPPPGVSRFMQWDEWQEDFTARLGRAASSLRDFASWVEDRGLHGVDTSALDAAAGDLEGRVRRLSDS